MQRKWIIGGALAGVLAALSPGTLFILLLSGIFLLILRRCSAPEDRRFVTGLFVAGLLARMALSVGLDIGSRLAEGEGPARLGPVHGWELNIRDRTRSYLKLGDSDFYSDRAYALAEYARGGREAVLLVSMKKPRPHGYLYAMGSFYYLFGFSPISVKFLNCLIGALMGPLLFFLAQACFDRWVGRVSSLLVTFLPSLMLWSASNLKDPVFITLTTFLFLLLIKIQLARTPWQGLRCVALLVPAALIHMTLRSDTGFSWALLGCAALCYVLARIHWLGRLGIGAAAGWLIASRWTQFFEKVAFAFYRHLGNVDAVSTPNSMTYHYLPAPFYVGGVDIFAEAAKMRTDFPAILTTLGKAVSHYLLEPTPARMGTSSLVMIHPQMMVWYALLPFAVVGTFLSFGRNFRRSGFLAATLAVWILIGALASGNIGLLFRVRDMVTPFIIVVAVAGLCWCLRPQPGTSA